MIVTASLVKQICPKSGNVDRFFPYLNDSMQKYEINTPSRIGAFISQVAEESANFHTTAEYATGAEYEGRKDLGNTQPGDGMKFKGRGLIQITGATNYKACSLALYGDNRLTLNPLLLEASPDAAASACWYWNSRNLNLIADKPEEWHQPGPHNYSKLQWITVLINGGLNGINERLANYNNARKILNF